jgi:cytochrome b5
MSGKSEPRYNWNEIEKHNSKNDCWLVIDNYVLDVTAFLDKHPAGAAVILRCAGKDATAQFKKVCHSKRAYAKMLTYRIGVCEEKR